MILKLRVPQRFHGVFNAGGWTYIDGVHRVSTHGPVLDANGDKRVFGSWDELSSFVASAWGPAESREFVDELWPEVPAEGWGRFLVVAVAYVESGGAILALLTEECFLLGPTGQTVDRLY